jgi:hypothetical protein
MDDTWKGTLVDNWLNHITAAQVFCNDQESWDIIEE